MPQGTIKKLVQDRGFGFIASEGKDVFFHLSSLQEARFEDLTEGQLVEYELDETPSSGRRSQGPRAQVVKPA